MLLSAKKLETAELRATDGVIGRADDFLFDDRFWHIRYLVVDTGGWLAGRRVLLSPVAATGGEITESCLPVNLTQEQIRRSPGVDAAGPISREEETELHEYYRWPPYWGGVAGGFGLGGDVMPGPVATPPLADAELRPANRDAAVATEHADEHDNETHLRSMRAVRGSALEASDGEIGHVEDFLIDPRSWQVRFLVIDTRNWWPGRKVLVAPLWLNHVSWTEAKVFVDLTREAIKASPRYDPDRPVERAYAEQLHQHYRRPTDTW